ncbi:MAG: hypothetical protein H5T61_09405 [Thermoflexales bacterium]|nr:hypothetical protein [Thermoflexales bacterium]
MVRKAMISGLSLGLVLLLGLTGCGQSRETPTPSPSPTETLPALAPGTTVIVDICDQNPQHPDCVGLQTPAPSPEWATFTDPLGRFVFLYPAGWYTMTVTPDPSDGVRVMDAPSLQESTRWVSVHVFSNTQRASLPVWVAEHGVGWVGEVIRQEEGYINGVPVLRQRLENKDPNLGGPYTYFLLWYPLEDWILRWTAWPGEQAETLDLLEQMVSTLRKP